MRAVLVCVAVCVPGAGCGASAPSATAATPAAAPTCDLRDRVSTRRAWLRSGTTPVELLDVARDQLLVATVRGDVIVTRWVTVDALAPVVREPTAVSPRAGAPADPAIVVLAGFRLPTAQSPWLAIRSGPPLAITGAIPANVRGTFWDEPPVDPRAPAHTAIQREMSVRAEPRSDAPVRGVIHPGARVRVLGRPPLRAPWLEIEALGADVAVTGFVEPPRPPPGPEPTGNEPECCEEIEPETPSPHGFWQIGTCLHDAPGGAIVGEVIGDVTARPEPGAGGWSSITVPTGWGDVRYHAKTPILEPPPEPPPEQPAETFEWPYRGEW